MGDRQLDSEERRKLEAALEKTTPATEFDTTGLRQEMQSTGQADAELTPQQFLNRTASDDDEPEAHDRTSTVTTFHESSEVLPELGGESQEPGEKRYDVLGKIGSGATSHVYAVNDRSLNRTIAVKFLRGAATGTRARVRNRFLHEARVTAMLEHPNIMPIHDIGVSAKGQVYFTMKNISGTTIGDAIRTLRAGESPVDEFRTIDGRVRVFLKICDALAYAHHRGFIHQDIKPDNIMLGRFGEVLLLDWGSALAKVNTGTGQDRSMYGTPAYMSPEQARRERATEASDVYCLAATMFHSLVLRHPTWADDPDTFWEKKRTGVVDELSDVERRKVPRALMAVIMKGLAPDVANRYDSVGAFASELKRWQEGQAVRAYRESIRERFVRWYKRNRKVFWTAAAASAIVGGVGTLLLREKVQEMVTWRHFYSDDFSHYGTTRELSANWHSLASHDWWTELPSEFSDSGYWRLDSGSIVAGFNNGFTNLVFNRPVPGDMRIEWTVTPLVMNLNLNCFVAGSSRNSGYTFHVGGMMNDPSRVFMTRLRNFQPIDSGALGQTLSVGRAVRLRMEKSGAHIRFYCNGLLAIDYEDADQLSGPDHQTFGFEACYYNSLRLDDVRVYYHPLPRRVSPLATADRFFARGYYADALANYREVAMMYPREELAAQSLFKSGLCLARLDSSSLALAALADFELRFPSHPLVPQSLYERSRIQEQRGDSASAHAYLRTLGQRYPGHPSLVATINDLTSRRLETVVMPIIQAGGLVSHNPDSVARILHEVESIRSWAREFGVSTFDNELMRTAFNEVAGVEVLSHVELYKAFYDQPQLRFRHLVDNENPERAMALFDSAGSLATTALIRLGRWSDVLTTKPLYRYDAAEALVQMGRLDEVISLFPDCFNARANALWRKGRLDEAMQQYPVWTQDLYRRTGRLDEWFRSAQGNQFNVANALIAYGRPDRALEVLASESTSQDLRYYLYTIDALAELGRYDEAHVAFRSVPGMFASNNHALWRPGRMEESLEFTKSWPRLHMSMLNEMGLFDSAAAHAARHGLRSWQLEWQTTDTAGLFAAIKTNRYTTAAALLCEGQYERLTRDYADQRTASARALLFGGKHQELRASYPDQRELCALSLALEGRFDDALAQFPDGRPEIAAGLVDAGNYNRVLLEFADQFLAYSEALVYSGRFGDVPYRGQHPLGIKREQYQDITGLEAIRAFHAGAPRRADSLLRTMESLDQSLSAQRFATVLLRPILAGLAGDTAGMRHMCDSLAAVYTNRMGQRCAYELRYLRGSISDSLFLAQPFRRGVQMRHLLLSAIAADIRGESARARAGYEAVLADRRFTYGDLLVFINNTDFQRYLQDLFYSRLPAQFVRARLAALSADQH